MSCSLAWLIERCSNILPIFIRMIAVYSFINWSILKKKLGERHSCEYCRTRWHSPLTRFVVFFILYKSACPSNCLNGLNFLSFHQLFPTFFYLLQIIFSQILLWLLAFNPISELKCPKLHTLRLAQGPGIVLSLLLISVTRHRAAIPRHMLVSCACLE